MPRVVGIDPGTVSFDICGLDDGRVFLDRSFPTAEALANPAALTTILDSAGPLDLVAGPSGYGLPLTRTSELTDELLRLAYLAAEGEAGGIGGLRTLMRALARIDVPIVLTPGVIHLPSVPAYRKVNRVDMGTADKVCAAALAIHQEMAARGVRARDVSFILVELGGAFTAALAVDGGRIVDGVGGTSGPLGARSAGAWDGEVAFLAGEVSKDMLFRGGLTSMGDTPEGWQAYLEGVVKTIVSLTVAAPGASDVIVSGRHADRVGEMLESRRELSGRRLSRLAGFAATAKEGAQGAALVADGLSGGASAELVETLGIREASGTALDYLKVISPRDARRRIGLA